MVSTVFDGPSDETCGLCPQICCANCPIVFAFGEGVQVSVHKYRQNKKAQTIKRLSVPFGPSDET